eukprot:gene21141-32569_t
MTPEPQHEMELYERILKQVEYYFSPQNLPRDGYMQQQMNERTQVPLSVIAQFRKVTELTTDRTTLLEALEKSSALVVEGEKGSELIRHKGTVNHPNSFVLDANNLEATPEDILALVAPHEAAISKEGTNCWVLTFSSADEASQHKEKLNSPGTGKTRSRITYNDKQASTACVRTHPFPMNFRPLLIGKAGSNIKRLQQQFPSLHIDTRLDTETIAISAESEEVIDEVIKVVDQYKRDPDERRPKPAPAAAAPDVASSAGSAAGTQQPEVASPMPDALAQNRATLQQQQMLQMMLLQKSERE